MRNSSEITKAVEDLLLSYQPLAYATVERSVRVNFDTSRMPWVGIYPGRREVEAATLGACSRRWRSTPQPKILLQEYGFGDEGQDAAEKLDKLLAHVLDAVSGEHNTGLKFGLDGVRLTGLTVDYTYVQSDDDESGEIFFPQAEITLTLEDR